MRYLMGFVAIASLAACTSTVRDSRSPSNVAPPVDPVSGEPLSALIEGSSVTSQSLDSADGTSGAPGISDEQDFSAVASRESIESDAQRLESYQAAYSQADPVAVPERPSDSSVSVVEYALSTNNIVGQSVYSRSALSGTARADRNCARYTSADFAQIAFLEAGGPKRDKLGLDPDGDGFACGWNPASFRTARGAAANEVVTEDSGISKADLEAVGITTDNQPAIGDPVPLPGDTLNISGETVAGE
ncbi:hypothetical protein MUY35_10615 [Aliiroseovarius sp. S1339]|uniref:hypothetical protein n=1 Tax=Aliiroseovarius sp. S1339 TaxID=2936990 RepID=UPI0020BEF15B|nr:hypothetical protein [Aliiroseovarius sp. S1339]MCK8464303.1 hypothetical protein [Aliiroseovarius sp. S1339]